MDDEYTDEDPPFETSRDDQAKYRCVICSYTLAELLGDILLKNKCMEILVKRQKRHPFTSSRGIAYGWTNTRENAPLRKWMVDAVASSTRKDCFSKNGIHDAGFPEDLVAAVVERLIQFRDDNKLLWPRVEDAEVYFECKTEKQDA